MVSLLQEAREIFHAIRGLLDHESRIVQALAPWLDERSDYGHHRRSFASTLEEPAKSNNLAVLVRDRDLLSMDGENLLLTNHDVHFIPPDQFILEVDGLEGFYLEIRDFPDPGSTWTSPFCVFGASKTEWEMVKMVFYQTFRRMNRGNLRVVISDSQRALKDD